MAYTSVIPVHRLDNAIDYTLDEKKSSRRENEKSLEGEIGKALNQDKTEQDLFQSALGCICETALEDMCRVKEMWHKEKGVQGFHLVQSFAAGEVTPELAHQIGLEFADQLLAGKFQAVVSTHLNTKCIHNHIVWNSVSMKNGRKYRSNQKTYVTEVRQISDELCGKHGLSVIHTEKSEQVARPYAQWLAEQNGSPTWKTPIQQDLNAAVAASLTWKQFLRALEQKGYAFRFDRKYPTLILPSNGRTVRFKTLGKYYTPEALQRRILYPKPPHRAGKEQPPANRFLLLLGEKPSRRLTGLRALYFSYLYKMGALPKKPRYLSYAVREDIRRLDQRIEQAEFIFQNKIEDRGQLAALRQKAEDEIAVLIKERQKLYRYQPGSPQITALTEKLRQLRHTAKLCRNIEIHSVEMEQRMQAARLESQKLREKQLNYGSDPADQIVRFTLEGTEMALKLSGMAAKNFVLFVYAVLKDQKKTHGKTRLVRMLKEQRPFKFFNVPTENMKEFAKEAKVHGLLYVPIRNKKKSDRIEVVVFADDASKIQRIFDNLGLDAVKAQAGEATIEKVPEQEKKTPAAPSKTETVKTEQGEVEFEVGGFEDDFNIGPAQQDASANFTSGREKEAGEPAAEKSPSEPSSPSKNSSPDLTSREEPEQKTSVKQQLKEIKQEQAEKKAFKSKQQERQHTTPGHSKQKKKQKGR